MRRRKTNPILIEFARPAVAPLAIGMRFASREAPTTAIAPPMMLRAFIVITSIRPDGLATLIVCSCTASAGETRARALRPIVQRTIGLSVFQFIGPSAKTGKPRITESFAVRRPCR